MLLGYNRNTILSILIYNVLNIILIIYNSKMIYLFVLSGLAFVFTVNAAFEFKKFYNVTQLPEP